MNPDRNTRKARNPRTMVEYSQTQRSNATELPESQRQMGIEARSLLLLIVGFGCLISFSYLLAQGFAGKSLQHLQPGLDPRLLAFTGGQAMMFLALAVMGWKKRFAVGPITFALAALCSVAAALIAPFEIPLPAALALAAVGGISSAVLAYAWMLSLSQFNMRAVSVAVLLGFTLACLIGESASLLGAELTVDITAIAAAVSAASLALLDPKLECCKPDGALKANDMERVPWLTIALIATCGFLAAAMCGVAGSELQVLGWQPNALVFEVGFAVTVLATVVVMFRSRSWTHIVWAPFLALFVAATVLSLVPSTEAVEFASGLMTAAMACGVLLAWLVLPSLLSTLTIPRAFLVGVLLACVSTPLAFLIGSAAGMSLPTGMLNLAGVAGSFAVVVSVLFAVMFIVNRNRFGTTATWTNEGTESAQDDSSSTRNRSDEETQPEAVNPADVLKARLAECAKKYSLTPRETEVALYTVQGFSCAYIAEHLVVSSSTVRFHQQNIYRKFDVHSRNELIEIVSQEQVSEQA